MKKSEKCGLLPVGMTDVLPPDAFCREKAVETVVGVFQSCGYDRVCPPLLEFEETLAGAKCGDLSDQTFRVTDPVSGKIMGVRADMTPQIGRIAVTRLKEEPRPLRLAYAGDVVRMFPTTLNPARQVLQVGAELIGVDCVHADAEIVLLAAEALRTAGVDSFVVDLNLPTLMPALQKAFDIDGGEAEALTDLLNQKDFAAADSLLKSMGKAARAAEPLFAALFDAFGQSDRVLNVLKSLDLPEEAAAERARLIAVADLIKREAPELDLTVDVLENRGFEYHCGVCFSIFGEKGGRELGRGGRYIAGTDGALGEPAVGVTLFMTDILNALENAVSKQKVFVPFGVSYAQAADLRAKGYVTVCGLKPEDGRKAARRLACDRIFTGGEVLPL